MKAKTGFSAAIVRAQHLLKLYELLRDTRQRGVRSDWSRRFKKFMGWPQREKIVRVDGDGTLLILKAETRISRSHFSHRYISELLRSAVVAAVSALDRYVHDLITEHSWKLLRRRQEDVPKELRQVRISALDVRKAVDRARKSGSRPGSLVKKSIQQQLHKQFTFQGSNQVSKASKMLGIKDFWAKVADEMQNATAGDVTDTLDQICKRRNQIVHEADLIVKSRGARPRLRDIAHSEAEEWVKWIEGLGLAIQAVADREL